MRSRPEIAQLLADSKLIAVIRARRTEQIIPLAEALVDEGIIAIEVTMTTPNAFEAIRAATAHFGPRALIGVGTVLNTDTCAGAIEAGAEFVVSPILRPEIAKAAHNAGRPVMLGAYTPTEAQLAHEAGSDFVKIFPADTLGLAYIKALRAPLPHLRIVPTGGVDLQTIGAFLQAGCAAVGLGSSLVSASILEKDDWGALRAQARKFVEAARAFKG